MFRLLAITILACATLPGVTLQQLSMDEMTAQATTIVRARVTGSAASFTGSTIYTHYKLQTEEALKGFPAVEVMVPGGEVKGAKQSFPGVPELNHGTEYVLFLWTSSTGITHLLGMSQGVFSIATQSDGSVLASRPRIGEMMLDRAGRRVADESVQFRLTDLRGRIRTAVRAGAR